MEGCAFMSTLGFARLWGTVGGQAVCWAAFDENTCVALLPGVEFGCGSLARFQSMPDGCYGSLVSVESGLDPVAVGRAITAAIARHRYLKTYITDFDKQLAPADSYRRIESRTLIVSDLSEDWQPPDKKLRSEIRKANRDGVGVVPFDYDRHFESFIKLVHQTESRHGRGPKYPPPFYRALAELAAHDNRVMWLAVEDGPALAASHIYFIQTHQLMHWQAYFDKAGSRLKPNQAMMIAAVRQAVSRGVTTLNMGASPPDAGSLAAYKTKWGSEEYVYPTWERRSWLGRWL